MKVKRFLARDMRGALKQVREQLGDEAVILTSTNLADGVEVMAGLEEDSASAKWEPSAKGEPSAEWKPSAKGEPKHNDKLRQTLQDLRMQENRAQPAAADDHPRTVHGRESDGRVEEALTEVGVVRSELTGIRCLLEQRLSGLAWDRFASNTPVQATIWERLNNMGLPGTLSRELLQRLEPELDLASAWRLTLAHLNRSIITSGKDQVAQGGNFALVGPTGAGKTTTIGKLATRYVLENGPDSVALVTTDSYRIAAHEQLRAFGRILGVTVRIVDTSHSLGDILESLRHKSLVLIDTAGLHQRDPQLKSQLEALKQQNEVKSLLVLPCTSQQRVLESALVSYSTAGLAGCVLSKIDEAGSLGEALSLVIERRLTVAYETHGQRVPDDLAVSQAHSLVSKAVALSSQQQNNREQLVNEFGAVYASAPG